MAQTRERLEFLHGDCREVLKQYESESFHACLRDPPCGIAMMAAKWDTFQRDEFIKFIAECFTEVYRVLVRLLQHLLRLITPPGGRVIDPFMGSGTAGLACVHEGFCYTGIDSDLEYVQLARERVRGSGGLLAL